MEKATQKCKLVYLWEYLSTGAQILQEPIDLSN